MTCPDGRANKDAYKEVINPKEQFPFWSVDPLWLSPSAHCSLSETDVHIWRGWLDQPAWRVQELAQTLSADECVRANRFHFAIDRARFIVARSMLKSILGRYLSVEPGRVQLCYGRNGKPYLHETLNRDRIRFNVAHSHELAVYAFTRAREIGIDLEYARPIAHYWQMVTGFMSAQEISVLSGLPVGQQQDAFYLCWTRKEAYIKATGIGLERPLEWIQVSLVPGEPACLLNVEDNAGETSRWSLQSSRPAPGYVAALAVEGHDWHVTCWDLIASTPRGQVEGYEQWNLVSHFGSRKGRPRLS